MNWLQEVIRWFNFVGFSALAAYAFTCPCAFTYACHFWEYHSIAFGLLAINTINFGVYGLYTKQLLALI